MRVLPVQVERKSKLWNVPVVDPVALDTAAPRPLAQVTRVLTHAIGEIGNVSQSLRSIDATSPWPRTSRLLGATPSFTADPGTQRAANWAHWQIAGAPRRSDSPEMQRDRSPRRRPDPVRAAAWP